MKKVAVIGTVGVPAKYGGFETLPKMWITLFFAAARLIRPD